MKRNVNQVAAVRAREMLMMFMLSFVTFCMITQIAKTFLE